jgi:hemolysin activation/secretion protein
MGGRAKSRRNCGIKTKKEGEHCFFISKIEFEGNSVISTKTLKSLVKSFEKKEMCGGEIKFLLSLISNYYIKKGYITSQVFVKEQDITTQTLMLTIIEGRVEDITFGSNTQGDKITLFFVSPLKKNDVVSIKKLDQITENLGYLSNYNYKTEVEAGSGYGLSILKIDGTKDLPVNVELELDNQGQEETGKYRYGGKISTNNIFSLAENISIKGVSGFNPEKENAYSRYLRYTFQMPIGFFRFSYDGSYSVYNRIVEGVNADFSLNGGAVSNAITLNYVLFRGSGYKLAPFLTFSIAENESFINDAKITTQSRKIASYEAGFQYNLYSKFGSVFTKISILNGIRAFGSLKDKDVMNMYDPHAQFNAYKFFFYYGKSILPRLTFSSSLDFQYSDVALLSQFQFSAGGSSTVRGFESYGIGGSSGFYSQNNLEFQVIKPISVGVFLTTRKLFHLFSALKGKKFTLQDYLLNFNPNIFL